MNYQEFKKYAASPQYQGTTEQKFQSFANDVQGAKPGMVTKGITGIKSIWNPNAKQELIDSTMDNMQQYADKFVNSMNIDDIEFAQQNYNMLMRRYFGNGNNNSPQARQFAKYVKDGLKRRTFATIMQNPVANIPRAAGIFIRQAGLNRVGDIVANPFVFYGGLAAMSLPAMFAGGSTNER